MFMLYDDSLKDAIVGTLEDKVSTIVNYVIALTKEGYVPNKNKYTKLSWSTIMIDAFENIDIFSVEQQKNLEDIYNKVISL